MGKLINLKRLNATERHALRKLCALKYEEGKSQVEISRELHISNPTINRWIKALEKAQGNVEKLREKARGRKPGTTGMLTEEQKKAVAQVIIDKTPDQLKFNFALWTSRAIAQYLRASYKIKIADRTVRAYMQAWGFTSQRPIRRAYEQNASKVKEWKETVYPEIVKRAIKEKAEIQWADETCVKANAHRPKGYAPKGQTPVVSIAANMGIKVNMISSITNTGKLRFMILPSAMNTDLFKQFMQRLIKDSKKKIFLIVDNLRVHHAKALKPWLEKHKDEIELFYLPSYSPDLNPDEYLNNDLKQSMNQKAPSNTQEDLQKTVKGHLKMRQRQPEVVKSFFTHECINYAA